MLTVEKIVKLIEADEAKEQAHSDIGASSCERWWNCPGSVLLSKGKEDFKSGAAIEGTFLHKLCELLLTGEIKPRDLGLLEEEEVEIFNHSFKVTEEMLEGVLLYYETVKADAKQYKGYLTVESRFCIESIDPGAFGTADAIINVPLDRLIVCDFKSGFKPVSPDSKQLKYYALGALETADTDFDIVELVVVQPKAYDEDDRVKRFLMTREELLGFKAELAAAIKRVREATERHICRGDWCTWCKAKPECPEHHKAIAELFNEDAIAVREPDDVVTIAPEKLQWVLDNEKAVTDFMKCVREYVLQQHRAGNKVCPNYKVVQKRANRAWLDEEQIAGVLSDKLAEGGYKVVKKILSPAQAEKQLKEEKGMGKAEAQELLGEYFYTPDNGVTLAHVTDKRQEVVVFDDLLIDSL